MMGGSIGGPSPNQVAPPDRQTMEKSLLPGISVEEIGLYKDEHSAQVSDGE